jgi:hypothetical protein
VIWCRVARSLAILNLKGKFNFAPSSVLQGDHVRTCCIPGMASTEASGGRFRGLTVPSTRRLCERLLKIHCSHKCAPSERVRHRERQSHILSLPDYSNQNLYLSYLTADGTDLLSGTTWNGISYESSNDGTSETVNSTITAIPIGSNGKVSVTVRDSQAVIANIGWLLGLNAVLTPNSTSTNPGTAQSGTKKSSAVTSTVSTSTALPRSALTTTVVWMSSVSS